MVATLIISITTIVLVLLSSIFKPTIKIKHYSLNLYWVVALLGALILLISNVLPWNVFIDGLISDKGMNPLKILVLFLSMTAISIFLDELGFFSHLASFVLKKCHTSQKLIFISFYILVSVLTMFTSNDIIVLTLTPFIIFFCKRADISPIPYLVSEFIAANTWSMIFIIGNPTNIYIASNFNITFSDYFLVMAVPTIVSGIVEFIILYLLFRKKLKEPIKDNDEVLEKLNMPLVIYALSILIICTILLVISSYVAVLDMWYIALGGLVLVTLGALIYSFKSKNKPKELGHTFMRCPYELIPFLLSMFVIALAFKTYGISENIHNFFGTNNLSYVYGYSSLLSANLINNIPMSVLYTSIIDGLSGVNLYQAVYATIIGSNIGAFLTPFGALAGIMWIGILKNHDIKYGFLDFIKYGVIVALPVITVALSLLLVFVN